LSTSLVLNVCLSVIEQSIATLLLLKVMGQTDSITIL
jgi:hypothetical protein